MDPVCTITLQLGKTFAASTHFLLNNTPDGVSILNINENFIIWFLSKTEVANDENVILLCHTITEDSNSEAIIGQLGGKAKAETTLAEMFACMDQQKNGESGVLRTDGYSNIFYVRDTEFILREVSLLWHNGFTGSHQYNQGGWQIFAHSIDEGNWTAGNRVFSRNS